jgi:hypothetical protein
MTLGVGTPEQEHEAAGVVQSQHDRGLAHAMSGYFGESPALTISRGDDVIREISNTTDYIKRQEGTSWPTPETPYELTHIGTGVKLPPKEVNVGAMSWAEALNYSPAPLTDNLGALRGGSHQEPAHELRPGFGEGTARNVTIGAILLGMAGVGWWMWSQRDM